MSPKCPVCGGPMKPLFQSTFCPRDCDRKSKKEAWVDVSVDDLVFVSEWDDEPTLKLVVCPGCGSTDTKDFPHLGVRKTRCVPCGRVF